MNKIDGLHIRRLLCAYGSFSRVANVLGVGSRVFRSQRNGTMPKAIKASLASASHALFLRSLLQEILRSGGLTRLELHEAAAAVRKRMEDPARVNKRALRKMRPE